MVISKYKSMSERKLLKRLHVIPISKEFYLENVQSCEREILLFALECPYFYYEISIKVEWFNVNGILNIL